MSHGTQITGDLRYNGCTQDEFVVERTTSLVNQVRVCVCFGGGVLQRWSVEHFWGAEGLCPIPGVPGGCARADGVGGGMGGLLCPGVALAVVVLRPHWDRGCREGGVPGPVWRIWIHVACTHSPPSCPPPGLLSPPLPPLFVEV